ncbi:MAG: hypothetical protein QW503_04005 [Sulfolobales archaeon]
MLRSRGLLRLLLKRYENRISEELKYYILARPRRGIPNISTFKKRPAINSL